MGRLGQIFFEPGLLSVDGFIGFTAQVAMFFRLSDALSQPHYGMARVMKIEEAAGLFASFQVRDSCRGKLLVSFEGLESFCGLAKSNFTENFATDSASCSVSERRFLIVCKLTFLEASFEYKSLFQHGRV